MLTQKYITKLRSCQDSLKWQRKKRKFVPLTLMKLCFKAAHVNAIIPRSWQFAPPATAPNKVGAAE